MYVHASYGYGVHYFISIILIITSIATMNLLKMYITVSTNLEVFKAYPTNMMATFGTFNMVTTTGLFYWQTAVWTWLTIVGVLFQPDLYPGRIFFQFFHHVA
jgi:hypothetical protein